MRESWLEASLGKKMLGIPHLRNKPGMVVCVYSLSYVEVEVGGLQPKANPGQKV
jgi:hypothetical protein